MDGVVIDLFDSAKTTYREGARGADDALVQSMDGAGGARSRMKEQPKITLKIVKAEDLDTDPQKNNRNRSALVQSFLEMADQLEKEIERIQQL